MKLIQTESIASLHRDSIIRWKKDQLISRCQKDFLALVEDNHAFNYQLWHAEDRARREDMGAEFVYQAKREIDQCNQQRNDRMEAMDAWLVHALTPPAHTQCPVHSETPGMMIDRLSILALKAFHMHLQTTRKEVGDIHRQTCQNKLDTIIRQQQQLQHCLQELLDEVQAGTRTFRVYHQFKMYNNPALNPQLYSA